MVPIKIKYVGKHELPKYATPESAGCDLTANIDEDFVLQPGQRMIVPTGVYLQLNPGYEAQVRPKSGNALKRGLTVLNTPGTVDSDYRGEVCVILYNAGSEPQHITDGMAIAQLVICPVYQALWQPVTVLDDTYRGSMGFGEATEASKKK